ncbi:MAG TPA: leucyl aminopeptidase [Actinomycetospora sp.]|nr:leucyl aminopeptidase [Actinomycetospora sp.]
MTSLDLSHSDPAGLKVDAVVVGVAKGADGPELLAGAAPVDAALGGDLVRTLTALGMKGKADETVKVPGGRKIKAPVVLAVGVGEVKAGLPTLEQVRRAAGAASRALAGTGSAAFALPAADLEHVAAVGEGALLGAYSFRSYKTGDNNPPPLGAATVVTGTAKGRGGRQARAVVARAEAVAEAVHQTRDWINTPPRDLAPPAFAEAARAAAKGLKLEVEVLDDAALRKGGYGGIVGVGQGSANPPRLVRIAYRGGGRGGKHVALVGKGITFDSGGLSLKPADAMVTMKSDMSGAAAVLATVVAVAKLGPKVNVTAWAPMAENMPSGSAQRPSDVLTTYGGKTVEVLNTDAEGRLVLADALVRACEDSPDLVVDVATLTGACVVALGTRVSGIMSNDDAVLAGVHAAAGRAGEQMWPLPLPEELREKLDSPVADIANVGERWGGALSAGIFLREFLTEGTRWAHLDIAGPAFNEGTPFGYTPKGGTGAAVRTLVQVVEDVAEGRL